MIDAPNLMAPAGFEPPSPAGKLLLGSGDKDWSSQAFKAKLKKARLRQKLRPARFFFFSFALERFA